MIQITESIFINENEIKEEFICSSGPGGQNVNKVSTAVKLKFNIYKNKTISWDIKRRIIEHCGSKITHDGDIVIDARRYRSQALNRKDALEKLIALIRRSSHRPKKRRATAPGKGARERRMKSKRQRSDIKRMRKRNFSDDE